MKNVILVDDNKAERRNISFILEQIKSVMLVKCFSNGLDAFEWLKTHKADIVITDVQMPMMDGMELIENIRKEKMPVEIIIISGYDEFKYARSAIGFDVIDYVMKPVIDDCLDIAIDKAVKKLDEKKIQTLNYEKIKNESFKSRQLLQDRFIRNLIVGNLDADYIKSNEKIFDINLSDGYKMIFIMQVRDCRGDEILGVTYGILDYILNRTGKNVKFFPFALNENEIGAIVVSENESNIVPEIINLKNEVMFEYNVSVLVGVSSVTKDITHAGRQYRECKRILEEKTNKNIVIMYDDLEHAEQSDVMKNMQSAVRGFVESGNEEEIRRYLVQSIALAGKERHSGKRNFAYSYVNCLEIILSEYGYTFDDIIGVKVVWHKLTDFDSIVNIENYLENLTMSVIEQVNSNVSGNLKLVKRIKAIIHERYMDHITVNEIANEVNFSRQHIDRIFAASTGMTIFDYLSYYRIETAKKLLADGESVDSVGIKVGYRNRSYFSEIFKDHMGISPNEFRNEQQKKTNKE